MISFNENLCIGYAACAKKCFRQCIEIKSGKVKFYNRNFVQCGHCLSACPKNAVIMNKYEDTSKEIDNNISINTEQILSLIHKRGLVRRFSKREVEHEKIII